MDTPPPQQHLVTRLTSLTFFLGLVLGLLVADLVAVLAAVLTAAVLTVDTAEPLTLFACLLFSAFGLLLWRRERLFVQFPTFMPPRRGASASVQATNALAAAVTGFGFAGLDLLRIIFSLNFPYPSGDGILVMIIGGAFALTWYLHRRGQRRVSQP